MEIRQLHSWDLNYAEARELQSELQSQLRLVPLEGEVKYIAGCDVSSALRSRNFTAAVVVMNFPEMEVIEKVSTELDVDFPYIPGLLSFREMPVLLKAWERITNVPDLIFCDGSGLIHPRKMGLACHLGLWLRIPVIGCAKNLLCGEYKPPNTEKTSVAEVEYEGEVVGAAVRTRTDVKPMFISPGNLISLKEAIDFVLKACPKYRIPEPIRAAHRVANEARDRIVEAKRFVKCY